MPADPEDLEAFIHERMTPTVVTGVPEIRLHLAGPSSGLARWFGDEAAEPYWAFVWGGGLALARYLLTRPEVVAGRRVLDLGSGSGLVGIAALQAAAASVVAVDVDPRAAVAARLNAALNGVEVEAVTTDLLTEGVPEGIDLVLVGDLFYETSLAEQALVFLRRCRAAGLDVLIGDPGRRTLPIEALDQVGAPPDRDFGGETRGGGVFRLA